MEVREAAEEEVRKRGLINIRLEREEREGERGRERGRKRGGIIEGQ